MIDEPQQEETLELGLLERVGKRIDEDYEKAKRFMEPFHAKCMDIYRMYNNAREFESLKSQNKFPVPFMQKHVDYLVATLQDKLFFGESPCRIVGFEEADKEDADAKHKMMLYQDRENGIRRIISQCLRDAAMYRICVATVNYREVTTRDWVKEPVPLMAIGPDGQLLTDQSGAPIPQVDPFTGEPQMSDEYRWVRRDVPQYRGSWVKRVDPMNLFITQDKLEIDDEFPVMIRSYVSRRYFDQPFFFNQDLLDEELPQQGEGDESRSGSVFDDPNSKKRKLQDLDAEDFSDGRPFEYIEWQGQWKKSEVYEWLVQMRPEEYEEMMPGRLYREIETDELIECEPGEYVWCIAGRVNSRITVRLEPAPYDLDQPNVVIGTMASEEDGLMGMSLAQKIEAVHLGLQELQGMKLANFKQVVNAMWKVDQAAWVADNPDVNTPGAVFKLNGSPDNLQRMEMSSIAPDLYIAQEHFEQMGQDAGGMQDTMTGQGERAAETLGEATQIMGQAALRLRDYLDVLENTFIKPVWRLRTQINSQFIDNEYAFRIIGEQGQEWRQVDPDQLKVRVDLVCESSTRETQKTVLVQQILELSRLAPLALQSGQPVRLDKLQAELAQVGFNWSMDKVKDIWPLIGMEEDQGGDEQINRMLAENALLAQAMMRLQMAGAMGGPGGMMPPGGGPQGQGQAGGGAQPGQQTPTPLSEGEAVNDMNRRSQTQL